MTRVVFLIQILLICGGRCNRYFWDVGLKIYRLPNFNMLFQLVQTKFFKSELFSCLLKDDHVITRSNGKGLFLRPRTVRNCVKVGSSSLLAEPYFWRAFYLVRVFRVANTHVAWLVYLAWLKQSSAKFPGQNTDLFFWINKVSDISSSNSEQACLRLYRLHAAWHFC